MCLLFVIVVFPDHTHLLFLNLQNVFFFRLVENERSRHIAPALHYQPIKGICY